MSKFIETHYSERSGWIRIFGRGLSFKDTTIHPLLFSQRNGYSKGKQFGKWWIGILKKNKP